MKRIAYIVLMTVFMLACSNTEKFIDNYSETNKALLAVNTDAGSQLIYMDLVDGTILNNDLFLAANGSPAPDSIGKAIMFRENIFVMFPKIFKIIVLNKDDFKIVGEIDFSADKLVPTDMCFANATDAYIAHGNSSEVSILDLTNFQIAKRITVGLHPVAIVASGNQIYTANQGDNSVSVIDSRTNREEATIAVAPMPSFIGIRSNGTECLVVSAGLGKLDATASKTAAIATFIDIATRNIIKETEIGTSSVPAIDANPLSMTISNNDWAFIPIAEYFLKISMRTKTSVSNIGKFKYSVAASNSYNGSVITIVSPLSGDAPKAVVCSGITGRKVYETAIPNGTSWIMPIY